MKKNDENRPALVVGKGNGWGFLNIIEGKVYTPRAALARLLEITSTTPPNRQPGGDRVVGGTIHEDDKSE